MSSGCVVLIQALRCLSKRCMSLWGPQIAVLIAVVAFFWVVPLVGVAGFEFLGSIFRTLKILNPPFVW